MPLVGGLITHTILFYMNEDMLSADHPYRRIANKIIDLLVEPATERLIDGEERFMIEDGIVTIINDVLNNKEY